MAPNLAYFCGMDVRTRLVGLVDTRVYRDGERHDFR
jgi:hypothetical protein